MPRAGRDCAGCQHGFAAGETFRALLYESPKGYERRDYCASCTPPAEPAPLATWRAQRPVQAAGAVQRFDREAVYDFFVRLEDADQPEKVQFRFVLALVLWRKRVLKFLRSVEADQREYWEFTTPQADQTHRVERPDLAEEQLEQLSAQLEQLLAGGPAHLDASGAPGPEEPADG